MQEVPSSVQILQVIIAFLHWCVKLMYWLIQVIKHETKSFKQVQTLIKELKISRAAEYLRNFKVMLILWLNTMSNVSILALKQDNGRTRDKGCKMRSSSSVFSTPIKDQFPLYFLYELLRISFLFSQKVYSQLFLRQKPLCSSLRCFCLKYSPWKGWRAVENSSRRRELTRF